MATVAASSSGVPTNGPLAAPTPSVGTATAAMPAGASAAAALTHEQAQRATFAQAYAHWRGLTA